MSYAARLERVLALLNPVHGGLPCLVFLPHQFQGDFCVSPGATVERIGAFDAILGQALIEALQFV